MATPRDVVAAHGPRPSGDGEPDVTQPRASRALCRVGPFAALTPLPACLPGATASAMLTASTRRRQALGDGEHVATAGPWRRQTHGDRSPVATAAHGVPQARGDGKHTATAGPW